MPAPFLQTRLHRAWQRRGALSWVLRPLSWLTLGITSAKRLAYRRGWKVAWRCDVPVLVVGNLYVGGTGKTPFLLAALSELQARGWRPGVVSRGYGAPKRDTPRVGTGALAPAEFGDEPSLIALRSGAPVSVHPNRALAAQALRAAHPEVDIILSDDGLQHLALGRDIEVLIQDGRGLGNGLTLPAGPLRESAAVADQVDIVVTNVGAADFATSSGTDDDMPDTQARQRAHAVCARAESGVDAKAGMRQTLQMQIRPAGAIRLTDGLRRSLDELGQSGERIAAVAGIGQPARFFDGLRSAGISLTQTVELADHFDFRESPFGAVQADVILITEKDAVKCTNLHDQRLWAVPVSVRFSDPFFFDRLHERLRTYGQRHQDTPLHGHTTA